MMRSRRLAPVAFDALVLLLLTAGLEPARASRPASPLTAVGRAASRRVTQPLRMAQGATDERANSANVTLICNEGEWLDDCAQGAVAVQAEVSSGSFAFSPQLYPNPTVALIDVSNLINGQPEVFIEEQGQILGVITGDLFASPGQVQFNLPILPTGTPVDVDNDGTADSGVQIFGLLVASNIIKDSYLQQLEQQPDLGSFLLDVASGAITEGSFLVHAPDDEQGFPLNAGADGVWFTADDPAMPLPAGYTLATLGADGTVTLDRSSELAIATIERAEAASPDFSEQGILESYHSLIDTLSARYAYTDLRGLDWEQIRGQYQPRVEAANANGDMTAYFLVLDELAKSLNDTHVAAISITNIEATGARAERIFNPVSAGIGAVPLAVSDPDAPTAGPGETILVSGVAANSPAAEAGWVPGTEIVTINGAPPTDRYDELPLLTSTGTVESRRVQQSREILSFPADQMVTIGYRLPGEREVQTATMATGDYYDYGDGDSEDLGPTTLLNPVTYEQLGNYAIVRWNDFSSDIVAKLAVLQEALAFEQRQDSAGIILDLRGNRGGWIELYETMAAHFFTAAEPMPVHLFDFWFYDQAAGEHVRSFMPDYQLSSPRPELAYTGPLVILVDEGCASSCEYFTQHLQLLDRATVIGQYATAGAGGFIDVIGMPGGLAVQFTQGRTTFAGTEEPNLEAKGVIPDIRVPVTLENELATTRGEDPVLDAAIAELDRLNAIDNVSGGATNTE